MVWKLKYKIKYYILIIIYALYNLIIIFNYLYNN